MLRLESPPSTLSGRSRHPMASGAVCPVSVVVATVPVPPGKVQSCRSVAHSMSSSARPSSDCGTASPSVFAVFRLTTNSK
jgi:hypothetical protein